MHALDTYTAACGILIEQQGPDQFCHLATAWSVAAGEWVTHWQSEKPPSGDVLLLLARDGRTSSIEQFEQDGAVAGFTSLDSGSYLQVKEDDSLVKRSALHVVAYPTVIEHPAFNLHRGSLDAERYFPYLCPWYSEGHLALFTVDQGYLAGTYYPGMAGGPVFAADGQVVGLITGGSGGGDTPPLIHFHRFV